MTGNAPDPGGRGEGEPPNNPPRQAGSAPGAVDWQRRIDETQRPFSRAERAVAELLARQGHTVTAVAPSAQPRQRTGDADVDGLRVEFKQVKITGATDQTVLNRLNEGKAQAARLVLDARGSDLDEGDARRGVRRALGAYPGRFEHVRIVSEGYDYQWPEEH